MTRAGVLVAGLDPESLERLRWATRLGALCGAVRGGDEDALALLDGAISLFGASGGFIGVCAVDGSPRVLDQGLDTAKLAAACAQDHEPRALVDAAGDRPVRLLAASVAAITLGGAHHDGPLLRIAQNGGGPIATLALWFDHSSAAQARLHTVLLDKLREPLLDALRRLPDASKDSPEAPMQVAALGAWSRCNVPLLFLNREGDVLAANPAAWRKLALAEERPGLPDWLRDQVDTRLAGLQRVGGLPDGVSGDYAWVAASGDSLRRVGLAPVTGAAGDDAAWLLSVESGGPTTIERVHGAADAFGLTPREADVLAALADGLSNRLIAEAIGISEATVKFHLVSVMRKASTSNRTELLSVLYSLAV
jgi:DNA-binding CsgD family transcriptional regulator